MGAVRTITRGMRGKEGVAAARKALHEYCPTGSALRLPIPIEHLALTLGYDVVLLTTVPEEFSALVSPDLKLIEVNRNHHIHRRRFSVGHEIGHILLCHPPEAASTPEEIMANNIEADACASELLMPEQLLIPMARKFPDADRLSKVFQVSVEAMRRRLDRLSEEFE